MESLDSEDDRTLLPVEETPARRGKSYLHLWPDDHKEAPITGLRGRSSHPRLGQAASSAAEVPAPWPAFDFLPVGEAQLREFMSTRKTRKEVSVNESKYKLTIHELMPRTSS